MKKVKNVRLFLVVAVLAVFQTTLIAGVPLTNLEGVGGVAFNPLAYPANPSTTKDEESGLSNLLGKPQIGAWYVKLGDVDVDWTSIGVAETLWGRLEVSYGYETIAPTGENITKDNFGAKLLLIEENSFDQDWFPAVSAGFIGKHTSPVASSVDSSGYDVYVVATKFLKAPLSGLLLSGGLLSTDGRATGVFGYDDDRDETLFGNADLLLRKDLALGVEYKQGVNFGDYKDADYWDTHLAWFINPNTTLVVAYVNAGDEKTSSKVGLGDGLVLSLQYAF